ncbi:hypothetical protein [Sanguibacter sp. 25GB23B1]|uniref:hypothetical protein n=1 Tax=unclassified Sanguibacter TaxID=2645534 RepID=UPI0032AF7DAD
MTSRGRTTNHHVRTALSRFGLTTAVALLVGVVPAVIAAVGTRRYVIWSLMWNGFPDGGQERHAALVLVGVGIGLGLVLQLGTVIIAARVNRDAVYAPAPSAVGAALGASGILTTIVLAATGSTYTVAVAGALTVLFFLAVAVLVATAGAAVGPPAPVSDQATSPSAPGAQRSPVTIAITRFGLTTSTAMLVGALPALVVALAACRYTDLTWGWWEDDLFHDEVWGEAVRLGGPAIVVGLVLALVLVLLAARINRAVVPVPVTSALCGVVAASGLFATMILAATGSRHTTDVGASTAYFLVCAVALVTVAASRRVPDVQEPACPQTSAGR